MRKTIVLAGVLLTSLSSASCSRSPSPFVPAEFEIPDSDWEKTEELKR